ncbi:hypothetical protein [Micromonospora lupini]|uniref:Uncharacterized protein n=1 Tax=Micromonospora lupini str. Lupac 08 TaxID=1150864 RepID=I0L3Q1_9ACTN|nr:hypothetical protein [Micromonospora lupini]CCH18448.1 hypothetical protein MILUP08_43358 [Micromonospora lupini str. Lupac 08]
MTGRMVELIAFSDGHLDDGDVSRFLLAYERARGGLSWVGESAQAFDKIDIYGTREIGLTHAFLAPGSWKAAAMEQRLLAEVRWLVKWLKDISGDLGLVFGLRFDDRDIGWIRRGVTDDAISEGLIGLWERDVERLRRESPTR